jgi:glycosyltransferase involved in cell wall biosynthesis
LTSPSPSPTADVCLLVEGTYPFVAGGVSSWVHDIIRGHPDLTFAVLNVGSHPAAYGEPRFQLPENVVGLHRVFCQETARPPLDGDQRAELREEIRRLRSAVDSRAEPSRVLEGLRRLHLEDDPDPEIWRGILADLARNDLGIPELLYGRASFDLLTAIAEQIAAEAPFLDLFWHYRAIHVPVLRLLSAPVVEAACYHAVSTGYAGLVAAAWSHRTGRPLALTEHGIYSRERDMELARADWIRDAAEAEDGGFGLRKATWAPRISPLRRIWSRFFRGLSRITYAQATRILTLSDVNRKKQIADGAPIEKIDIVPNGVDLPDQPASLADAQAAGEDNDVIELRPPPMRVGFVGRVVPIKDLITFIRACDIALRSVELDVRVIGPMEEDGGYASRCRDLVARLGRAEQIRFVGPMPPSKIYPDLDVVVLTSFSEGQPLVILEAYACGVPVIATAVGACREMIEGRMPADRAIGPSGFVTRVANPQETASALIALARDPKQRRRMGAAGRKRVTTFYQRRDMLAAYRALYVSMGAGGGGAAALPASAATVAEA